MRPIAPSQRLGRALLQGLVACGGCLLLVLGMAGTASGHAGHAHVTTLADVVAQDGACSLREAIINTNQNTQAHTDCATGSGSDLILFDLSGTIRLTEALPALSDPAGLLIDGLGRDVRIDGAGSVRPFTIEPNVGVTMRGLTITAGRAGAGGGMLNAGALTLADTTISGSTATSDGGGGLVNTGTLIATGLTLDGNSAAGGGEGGGLLNLGSAMLANVTLSGNHTATRGGGLANRGAAQLFHATVAGNEASSGGGVWNGGTLTLANSLIASNSAPSGPQCAGPLLSDGLPNLVEDTSGCVIGSISDAAALGVMGFLVALFTFIGLVAVGAGRQLAGKTVGAVALAYAALWGANAGWMAATNLPLVGPVMGVAAGTVGATAGIGPLQDNGGRTRTHALAKGSAALDSASPKACAGPPAGALDQRGQIRPEGAGCDLGAYEGVPVGGRDFEVGWRAGRFHMDWLGGVEQDAYALRRWVIDGPAAPAHAPLPAAAATAGSDAGPAGALSCFAVEATGAGQRLGLSDVLCGMAGMGGGPLPAPEISLRLRQSPIAVLTWSPVVQAQQFVLASVPVRGGTVSFEVMAAGAVRNAAQNTQGAATCYALIALNETQYGMSDVLCAVPNAATVGRGPTAGQPRADADQAVENLRPGLQSVRQQLQSVRQRLETGQPLR